MKRGRQKDHAHGRVVRPECPRCGARHKGPFRICTTCRRRFGLVDLDPEEIDRRIAAGDAKTWNFPTEDKDP